MIGRIFGWFLVVLAALMASGDAVMALGDVRNDGLSTGEVWTLLAGKVPDPLTTPDMMLVLYAQPAWGVLGVAGLVLLLMFRRRAPRRGQRHARSTPAGLQSSY